MISAGNDIVSFAETNPARSTQPAFYKKFVTDSELALCDQLQADHLPFDRYIWLLWSAKEAAFKYLHRLDTNLVFSPIKFQVSGIMIQENGLINDTDILFKGQLSFQQTSLSFTSSLCSQYVHTVVVPDNEVGDCCYGVKQIADHSPENQSEAVRALCQEQLALRSFSDQFSFIKSADNVPSILDIQNSVVFPVSFSHHGCFVAYSF